MGVRYTGSWADYTPHRSTRDLAHFFTSEKYVGGSPSGLGAGLLSKLSVWGVLVVMLLCKIIHNVLHYDEHAVGGIG